MRGGRACASGTHVRTDRAGRRDVHFPEFYTEGGGADGRKTAAFRSLFGAGSIAAGILSPKSVLAARLQPERLVV